MRYFRNLQLIQIIFFISILCISYLTNSVMIHIVFGILIQTCIFLIYSFKQLFDKTYFHYHIFHPYFYLWITSSSYTCYQNLSLEYFGANSKVSAIFIYGEHYFSFIKKNDYQVKELSVILFLHVLWVWSFWNYL